MANAAEAQLLDRQQVTKAVRALMGHLSKADSELLDDERMLYLQIAMKRTPDAKKRPIRMWVLAAPCPLGYDSPVLTALQPDNGQLTHPCT